MGILTRHADCHPSRVHKARGLCESCYAAKWARDRRRARGLRSAGLQPSVFGGELQARRFWAKVDKGEGCWEWRGGTSRGYGSLTMNKRKALAHRLSWIMANGPIPKGLQVCHHCDNRRCVRPDHLFVGSQGDNMRDMMAKGRQNPTLRSPEHLTKMRAAVRPENRPRGEGNRKSKLTDEKVRLIRALRLTGLSQQVIADRIGVAQTSVSNVLRGKTWAHVKEVA